MNLLRAIRDAFLPPPPPPVRDREADDLIVALRRQREKAERQNRIFASQTDWNDLFPKDKS